MKYPKTSAITLLLICFVLFAFQALTKQQSELLKISRTYQYYQQYRDVKVVVTDSSRYKWTIALCYRPKNLDMGWHLKIDSLLTSNADPTTSPHGNKLYRLFVKNYGDYMLNAPTGQLIGQTIVKETWNISETTYDSINKRRQQFQSKIDGKWYAPSTISELFIMYKQSESSDNDKGWVYGIVAIEDQNT